TLDVIGTETLLAAFAIDQRVGEVLQMARGFPGARMLQDRAVETDDVAARRHHRAPPRLLDVALEFDAERAVVPRRAEAAVDLACGEDDSAALAEIDQLVHRDRALAARGRCLLGFLFGQNASSCARSDRIAATSRQPSG